MYRFMNYKLAAMMVCSLILTACGQSGALHLPKDASSDKRAKYLVYKEQNYTQATESSVGNAEVSEKNTAPTASNPTP